MEIVTQTNLRRSRLVRLVCPIKFAYHRLLVDYIIQVLALYGRFSLKQYSYLCFLAIVLLTTDGQVYTFGSNSYGQLGVGDLSSRGSPTLVKITSTDNIVMVAAGSHHTVVLTSDGDVLTWGAHLVT